jgi:nicotinamide phosphoribosyltransferase
MKATSGIVNGERREIFKDPKTDSGTKRSAKGLLRVEMQNGNYTLFDQQTPEQEQQGALEVVFENGIITKQQSLAQIRDRLESQLQQMC